MKKCPVCGKEWSDATRFCGSCGAKLEDGNIVVPDIVPDDGKEEQRKKTEPVKPSVKKTIEPVRPKTRETAENKKIEEEKEEEKNTAERKRAEYNKSDAVLPVKRRKKGWKIATALGLTAIVAVGAVVFCVKSGENMEHPFVELYGDSYEILTKEKLGHTITITDNGLDWLGDAVMQLSPDRKYLYYMENYDISTGTSRLYRCEYQKLSKKEEKNEKYKTKVAANVRVFYPLENGKLLYIDKDSELFCYDGEVSVKIADSLQGYYQLKDGTGLVYTKGNADEGFDVCGVSYNNPTEEVFLADGMTDVMLADDQEHILCRRYDGQSEDDQLVFLTSFEEETKELGTPVSDMYAWENGAVYYFASGENTECELEDFVIDSRGNTEQWQELQKEAESYHPVPTECQSLYEYKDGEIKQITANDINNAGLYRGNSVLYLDVKKMEPVDLAEVKDADYMIDLLDQRIYEQGMYVKPTSRKNSIHIIGEVAKKIEDIDEEGENFWIYANETDLFLESGSDFWHAAIKNDEVSDLEEMPEGYVKSVTPTEIYYTSNFYTEGDNAYYDVNVIENGKSRCLAKEVLEDYVKIYEDGTVMAYTDRNSDGEYELSIFDKKGNKTKIADGVTKAIREEDGDIVYDSRHDLMLYQKEESERIGIGIVDFWYADEMKTEQNFRLDW